MCVEYIEEMLLKTICQNTFKILPVATVTGCYKSMILLLNAQSIETPCDEPSDNEAHQQV